MTQYIQFEAGQDKSLLVEIGREEEPGMIKAGLGDKVRDAVVAAGTSMHDALVHVIQANARLFIDAAQGLERPPTEMELSFALKATGEIGSFAVAKAGGEANYSVRFLWQEK